MGLIMPKYYVPNAMLTPVPMGHMGIIHPISPKRQGRMPSAGLIISVNVQKTTVIAKG
jgi:hypothetical protein